MTLSVAETDASEQAYNRLLRRVDWRFLLPNPWPVHTVCFTSGLLALAVEKVSGSVAYSPKGRHCDFDLAVVRNPSRGALREAWQALRPGGRCYTEWYWPRPNGLCRVRRELHGAGFTDISCYWPYPPRMPSGLWLPLDSPATIERWRTRRQELAFFGTGNFVDQAKRLVLMVGLRAGITVPICALARKPLGAESGFGLLADGVAGPGDPNKFIATRWSSWGFGPAPDRLSWLLATGGWGSGNKVVGIVSAEHEGVPRVVVKMPRVLESVSALEREAAMITRVHSLRPNGMAGVPRLLFYEARNGFARLGETYLEGVPLFNQFIKANYRSVALKATDWLTDLAIASQRRASVGWRDRQVDRLVDMSGCAPGQMQDGRLLQRLRRILGGLGDLPSVCEHGDFFPLNILMAPEGGLAVLDWESAEMEGLPGLDLIYFLTFLAFLRDGVMESGDYLESHRASLNPSTFTGGVRTECLTRYAGAVGLDLAVLRPLELLFWFIYDGAFDKAARLMIAGSPSFAMWQEDDGWGS